MHSSLSCSSKNVTQSRLLSNPALAGEQRNFINDCQSHLANAQIDDSREKRLAEPINPNDVINKLQLRDSGQPDFWELMFQQRRKQR